jgi:dienelactone hydrolase
MQKPFIKIFVPLLCAVSCANHQPANDEAINVARDTVSYEAVSLNDVFPKGKVIKNIVCKNQSSQSFALYIPANGDKKPLPVIYFFDPHADGALPLNKYKSLANKYGFILIGSNNSKNGNDFSTAEDIWSYLFADTKARLNIDTSQIYVCGFSGGAKVAGEIALNHGEVKGVIANSAALPDGTPAGDFNFTFTGIAGDGDMNMTDVVAFTNELSSTKTFHRMIMFEGKHEWCPEATMDIAFQGLVFDEMRSKAIALDNDFIKKYISETEKNIKAYVAANNYLKADEECKLAANMLADLTKEADAFKEKATSFSSNPTYQKQLKQQQDLFAIEENTKASYQQQFQTGDINYWTKTIQDLNTKAKTKTDEGAMYNRLLAYLSLAFYSISNQLINANQNEQAAHFVALYQLADPTNSEAYYFAAILDARNNNTKVTEDDLMKAAQFGFNDKERMEQQKDFQTLLTPVNFGEIENKMKPE